MYPGVFSPYPGSELYDRLAKEGKVDLYSQDYMMSIIGSHDLLPDRTYNDAMGAPAIKFYTVLMYLAFYGSNFLFRPQRLFRMIKNMATFQHESRAELVLSQTFTKFNRSI
jgi:hypothetical protein